MARRTLKYWTQEEINTLPGVMKQYNAGDISKAAIREMFQGRSFPAIQWKFKGSLNGPLRAHVRNGHHNGNGSGSVPRLIRMLEGDRIVTCQELITAGR